ncbi:hypothetical protein HNR23_003749 [Nocardiopsis mwathae]|uniref:Uncharacterized protein n=1 Tax=Nocardiopsis mwathae TaxID=1472723 RepID=A0A7X0D863_9ACTN|nr:hypothetical protein [Nocardiopsis mwathae]MBB6173689.1 hypothetical protein [Nocardiopsis mwathae]
MATSFRELMTMSILPSRRSRRIRPYIAVLEHRRAVQDRRFREFARAAAARTAGEER